MTLQQDPNDTPSGSSAYAWFVVCALSFVNLVSMVERQLMTLMFGPIRADLNLNDTEVSLLSGFAFVVFYIGFGLVVGRLADHGNRARIIKIGIISWGLATVLCGFARSFIQLFVTRMAVGIGEATLNPSAFSMIADYFSRQRLARANSLYYCSSYMGPGVALLVGGVAIQFVAKLPPLELPHFGTFAPWQMTFILIGLVGNIVVLPMLFVKEPPRRDTSGQLAKQTERVTLAQLFSFFKTNRRTYGAIFPSYIMMSFLGVGTLTWVPTYFIRVHGWTASEIGYVYGLIFAIVGGSGVLVGGRLTEWMQQRHTDAHLRFTMLSMGITTIPVVIAVLVPNAVLSIVCLAFGTFFQAMHLAPGVAAVQLITPNRMRAQVLSIHFFLSNLLGAALGPTVVAMMTDYVFRDENALGSSMALVWLVVGPLNFIVLARGLAPYRASLQAAQQPQGRSDR